MQNPVEGAGLGLRRGLMSQIADLDVGQVDFLELAPENWLNVGGKLKRRFDQIAERFPLTLHGLSLSLGSPAPLDEELLQGVAAFMRRYSIRYYSDHLSYCGDDGHLYDLMPIPFTEDAVDYVAERIRRAQDIIGERIAVENISYYATTGCTMTEIDFISAVLEQADCDLLLDINNIVVNSINHSYDALAFLHAMPVDRVRYFHVAGHYVEAPDLRVDTHGDAVSDPVWELLAEGFRRFGPVPTLLERDFNFPPIAELLAEVDRIKALQGGSIGSHGAADPGGQAVNV